MIERHKNSKKCENTPRVPNKVGVEIVGSGRNLGNLINGEGSLKCVELYFEELIRGDLNKWELLNEQV